MGTTSITKVSVRMPHMPAASPNRPYSTSLRRRHQMNRTKADTSRQITAVM